MLTGNQLSFPRLLLVIIIALQSYCAFGQVQENLLSGREELIGEDRYIINLDCHFKFNPHVYQLG
jgi:hypothetical protein